MITRLVVKNYRALRETQVSLGPFHVLVGPNGSGKSTFLDVLSFLRDCLNLDLREAVRKRRVGSLDELTFGGAGGPIEIQVEFDLGEDLPAKKGFQFLYFLKIQADPALGVRVVHEQLITWPRESSAQDYAMTTGRYKLLGKDEKNGHDQYLIEGGPSSSRGNVGVSDLDPRRDEFAFGVDYLALSKLPPDSERYPSAVAARALLTKQVNLLNFIPSTMAVPCPPLESEEFAVDGHNLARVAARILNPRPGNEDFDPTAAKAEWLDHLRLALPDLKDITWAQNPPDRAEYLQLTDRQGLVLPSWSLSEGTLRMLGLTLLPFLPRRSGIHLIEEPENAVHPHALEVIIGALRGIPRSQVMLTTHSPLVVDLVGKDPLLIFSKKEGAVSIQTADQHSALKDWDGSHMLSSLFSAGYLQ